jgi:omega-6 fatty acid desaturase (delta-12 desaturase)
MKLAAYLDQPRFRGSAVRSARVLGLQAGGMIAVWSALARHGASEPGAWAPAVRGALTVCWALCVLRAYMIFHDCGHGSFFQGFAGARTCNWLALHASAVMCGTPTDWTVGHRLHHAHVGNLGQDEYDWGETIFHTAAGFRALSRPRRVLWRMARHPLPFFALAPLLTWYVRMRLPFELRPGRRAAYRAGDKALSSAWMAARYALAHSVGGLSVILGGDYLAMFLGVLLFHWQHVFAGGYVRSAADWTLVGAATQGSSMLAIPRPLKVFTLGIEYHHIHHFRTKIPGYMLGAAHADAPVEGFDDLPGGFAAVPLLGWREMWASVWMQCYDEATRTFAPFPLHAKCE